MYAYIRNFAWICTAENIPIRPVHAWTNHVEKKMYVAGNYRMRMVRELDHGTIYMKIRDAAEVRAFFSSEV